MQMANIGLMLSLIGVVSVALAGWTGKIISTTGMYLAFASLPGAILSLTGYFSRPSRTAAWGIATGVFGSFYLATFWFGLTH